MQPPFLEYALWASLALCAAGVLFRASAWFRLRLGPDTSSTTAGGRLLGALKGSLKTVASVRLLALLRAFFLDSLLQTRLLLRAPVRWAAHMLVFGGFMALLVVHALDDVFAEKLFTDYAATKAPFLFLRDLFGALVLTGLVLGLLRRLFAPRVTPKPTRRDPLFVLLLAVIMLSGYGLAAVKVSSAPIFYEMSDEYLAMDDPEELLSLRILWEREYGVVFEDSPIEADPDELPDLMEEAAELNEDGCVSCHARPQTAFASWALADALAPLAQPMAEKRTDRLLYIIHVLACLLALAYLPFSRLLHVFVDPLSLAVASGGPAADGPAENRATRRALALDACVRCGLCDERCSVIPSYLALENEQALPSHRLAAARALARSSHAAGNGDEASLARMAEGASTCTACGRCTERCPVGLDLQDLWPAVREELERRGHPTMARRVRLASPSDWAEAALSEKSLAAGPTDDPLLTNRSAFSACVQCQTCTNVCPVVSHSACAAADHRVELTPQKVMNLLRLGLVEHALGARMTWDCATCYLCQEHCPEGIRVTDILIALRTEAKRRLPTVPPAAPTSPALPASEEEETA